MELTDALRAGHGVASSSTMARAGVTKSELRSALRQGAVRRIRPGWYATDWAHPQVTEAVAAGGVLTCLSALRLTGVWVPPTEKRLHVRARPSAHRGRAHDFCTHHGRPLPESGAVDDLATALRHALRCLDLEGIVVVLDSILHLGLMSSHELEQILRDCPDRIRAQLDRCDRAESGTETMVRLRLRKRGVQVTPQAYIPNVGRVDFLVGKRLILEVDGQEYHADPTQFELDRERDQEAIALGYIVIRMTYKQVVYRWAKPEAAVLAVIRRRDHAKAPASGRSR